MDFYYPMARLQYWFSPSGGTLAKVGFLTRRGTLPTLGFLRFSGPLSFVGLLWIGDTLRGLDFSEICGALLV